MPLYDTGQQVCIKVVGYHPQNPEVFDVPTILSTVSVYNTHTGHLEGIMDGVLLTALRTGATSAVASKYLAHSASKTFGMIGCGAQSITQLHAISRVFDIQTVKFYDIDEETMATFPSRCKILNLKAEFIPSSIQEIVTTSDIFSTATSIEVGKGPLFENLETLPHAHVNAVGSDFPGKTELPMDILSDSFICPEFIKQALIEGECQQLNSDEINASLLDIVKNTEHFPNIKSQRTVFDSTGWALEDRVTFELFIEYAQQLNIGQYIAIEQIQEDVKNPYEFL
jgi:ornithine cyclodeaminase/alanine dehydrogenase-like protein (mu-crystallin family)